MPPINMHVIITCDRMCVYVWTRRPQPSTQTRASKLSSSRGKKVRHLKKAQSAEESDIVSQL
jgi:hypothetical protein